jgi:hypothetical protein
VVPDILLPVDEASVLSEEDTVLQEAIAVITGK